MCARGLVWVTGINTGADVEVGTRNEGIHSKIVTTEFTEKKVNQDGQQGILSSKKRIRTPHVAVL